MKTGNTEFVKGKHSISWAGSKFKKKLGDLSITLPKKLTLTYQQKLDHSMLDSEILTEFKPTDVSLGEILVFLKNADKTGQYIFYVKATDGTLWAVFADWYGGGWGVEAFSVSFPGRWGAARQVVSREPLSPSENTLGHSETLTLESRLKSLEERIDALADWAKSVSSFK